MKHTVNRRKGLDQNLKQVTLDKFLINKPKNNTKAKSSIRKIPLEERSKISSPETKDNSKKFNGKFTNKVRSPQPQMLHNKASNDNDKNATHIKLNKEQSSKRTLTSETKSLINATHKTLNKEQSSKHTVASKTKSVSTSTHVTKEKHTIKISDSEATDLEIDSDLILEIVQSTSGIALALGLIVFIYRSRNRFNKLVKRTLPKSKYPPGQITELNPQHAYNLQAASINQYAPTNQQVVPFSGGPNQDFATMHAAFKPTFKTQTTMGEDRKQIST